MLLRMQFVRGPHDTNIRGQLLQNKNLATFNEVINSTYSLEAASLESNMMKVNPKNVPQPQVLKLSEINKNKDRRQTERA